MTKKKNKFALAMVTGLGTGYFPFAPGTVGSFGACVGFILFALLFRGSFLAVNISLAVIAIIFSWSCVHWGEYIQEHFGKKDPSQCTSDEWAGQAVALFFLPYFAGNIWWWGVCILAGFLAFRFFDILKPPPARQFEKFPFGWGVLMDDLMAGVYANIVCQVALRLYL